VGVPITGIATWGFDFAQIYEFKVFFGLFPKFEVRRTCHRLLVGVDFILMASEQCGLAVQSKSRCVGCRFVRRSAVPGAMFHPPRKPTISKDQISCRDSVSLLVEHVGANCCREPS
jgi:hypothetical protein